LRVLLRERVMYKTGDIVRHTGKFLRSIQWYTPPVNGRVVETPEDEGLGGCVMVEWSDGNICLIDTSNIELDPKDCGR
jgi:hypothetical protein